MIIYISAYRTRTNIVGNTKVKQHHSTQHSTLFQNARKVINSEHLTEISMITYSVTIHPTFFITLRFKENVPTFSANRLCKNINAHVISQHYTLFQVGTTSAAP